MNIIRTVEEVANMVVYLASPQASATSGAALRVDGGVVDDHRRVGVERRHLRHAGQLRRKAMIVEAETMARQQVVLP